MSHRVPPTRSAPKFRARLRELIKLTAPQNRIQAISPGWLGLFLIVFLLGAGSPALGQVPPPFVSDHFARTVANGLGTTETGQSWLIHAGTASVQPGMAQVGNAFFLASLEGGTQEGNVEAKVSALSNEFWVIARFVNESNYWRFGRWHGGPYQLQQVQNGALGAPVIVTPVTRQAQAGDSLRCLYSSQQLKCSVNGIVVAVTSDTSGVGATKVGLSAYQSADLRFTEFLVTSLRPDLVVEVNGPPAGPMGTMISWTATVKNEGGAAAFGSRLVVTAPQGVANLTFSGASCTQSHPVYECSLGVLEPNAASAVAINLTATATGPLTVPVTVPAVSGETDESQNSASYSTVIDPPLPAGAVVLDTFERPDGATIATANTGQSWTHYFQPLTALQGKATPGAGLTLSAINSGISNSVTSVTLAQPSAEFWLVSRLVDAQNYWRFGRSQNGAYQLQQVRQGSLGTPTITTLANVLPAAGDALSCLSMPGLLECRVNDVPVVRSADATGSTATRGGLSAYQGTALRFDNFMVSSPPQSPEVSVSVSGPSFSNSGSPVSWIATVHNDGSIVAESASLAFTAPLIQSPTFVGAACTGTGPTWNCPLGSIPPGETITVRLDATAPAVSGIITVTAASTIYAGESQNADNVASASTYIHNSASGVLQIYDAFDRPDSNVPGTSSSGHAWTVHSGAVGIQNGQLALGAAFSLASIEAAASSLEASVTVTAPAQEFWLIVRFANNQNYWRFGRSQNQAYQLQQVVQGGLANPAITVLASPTPAAGDRLSCRTGPSLLECSVNGVAAVRTTSNVGSAATAIGISGYQAASARFENLAVAALSADPDLSISLAGPSLAPGSAVTAFVATIRNLSTIAASPVVAVFNLPLTDVVISGASCTASGGGSWTCTVASLPGEQSVILAIQGRTPALEGTMVITGSVQPQSGETSTADNTTAISTYVRSAAAGIAVLYDSFDRPDASTLNTATTGQLWAVNAGAVAVSNNQAAPGDGFTMVSIAPGASSWSATVVVKSLAPEFWLLVRVKDSQNYWRFGRSQGGAYQLQQISMGAVASPLITPVTTVNAAAGDVVSCDNSPTLLECAVNGTVVAKTSEPVVSGADSAGLSTYQASVARFDDFLVTRPHAPPDLSVALSGPSVVVAGTPSNWTVSVLNLSTSAAQLVEALVQLPAGTAQATGTGASCTTTGLTLRCVVPSIAPGQLVSLTVNLTMQPMNGHISVAASVTALDGETATANNSAAASTYVHDPATGTLRLYDAFDRPDMSGLGAAVTGQVWTMESPGFAVSNTQALSGSGFSLASINTGSATVNVSVKVAQAAPEFWLTLRHEDDQNYWRFGRWNNGPYQLQMIHGGALSAPAVNVIATVTPQTGDSLHCQLAGNILCSVNGAPVLSTLDSTGSSATRIGLSSYGASSVRFDELLAVTPLPAPNMKVEVAAPRHVLISQSHSAAVSVRNVGEQAAAGGTVLVTLPAWITIQSVPQQCTAQGAGKFGCAVAPLSAGQAVTFPFGLIHGSLTTFNGRAELSAANDPAYDNVAAWNTWVHTAGTVIDGFERTGSSGLGTSPTNHVWTALSGGFQLSNGTAQAASAGALTTVNPGFSFGTMEVVLGNSAATTGLVFRVANASNYYRLAADESGYYALRKVIGGVVQPLAMGYVRAFVRPNPGDVVRLITRPDDGVFVAVNGQQILDFGDPELMTASGWGIASVNGPGSVADFSVDPRIVGYPTVDNFNGVDGTNLEQPTSGSLYNWRPWLGTPWIYQGGQAKPTYSAYTYTWVDTTSEQAADAEVKITQLGAGAWIIFRVDELTDTYFRFGQQGGVYNVQFVHHDVLGTSPASIQVIANPVPQNGDVVKVRQQPDGTVECFVNGVLTHRFIDNATNVRWTLYGLASHGSQSAFDDFRVTPFGQ